MLCPLSQDRINPSLPTLYKSMTVLHHSYRDPLLSTKCWTLHKPQRRLHQWKNGKILWTFHRSNIRAPRNMPHLESFQMHIALGNSAKNTSPLVLHANKMIPLFTISFTCLLEKLQRHRVHCTCLVVLPSAPSLLAICSNPHHQHHRQLYKNHTPTSIARLGNGNMGCFSAYHPYPHPNCGWTP